LIGAGLLLVLFFGWRAARSSLRLWRGGLPPEATDVEAIRGWMTIPYIAKAYHVPEPYLFERLGLPPEENRDKSLAELNQLYRPNEPRIVILEVQEAIQQFQAGRPPPPP
jgi:hypothetical protein